MLKFLQRFAGQVIGVVNGLDRIRFRGTKRLLANVGGMIHYLRLRKLLNRDFKPFALALTEDFKKGIQEQAEAWGQPIDYAASSQTSATKFAAKTKIPCKICSLTFSIEGPYRR